MADADTCSPSTMRWRTQRAVPGLGSLDEWRGDNKRMHLPLARSPVTSTGRRGQPPHCRAGAGHLQPVEYTAQVQDGPQLKWPSHSGVRTVPAMLGDAGLGISGHGYRRPTPTVCRRGRVGNRGQIFLAGPHRDRSTHPFPAPFPSCFCIVRPSGSAVECAQKKQALPSVALEWPPPIPNNPRPALSGWRGLAGQAGGHTEGDCRWLPLATLGACSGQSHRQPTQCHCQLPMLRAHPGPRGQTQPAHPAQQHPALGPAGAVAVLWTAVPWASWSCCLRPPLGLHPRHHWQPTRHLAPQVLLN